jgi:hypothetical protein
MKKTLRYFMPLVVALVALLGTTGCKTVAISSMQYIGGPTYAPTDPASIQILRVAPTRPNVRLGEVTAEPSSESVPVTEIEAALRNAAAKMGANAVVIVSDRTQVTGAMVTGPWYGRSLQETTARVVVGVAIRYTGP